MINEKEKIDRFNSDLFLQKVYNKLKNESELKDLSIIEFMKEIDEDSLEIYNSVEEWFETYISDIYEIDFIIEKLVNIMDNKINKEDIGKSLLQKFLEVQIESSEEFLYIIDNKIVKYCF